MARLTRAAYADMFGPTTGDRVRLADTELFIQVERDLTIYGEEVKFGGGKVIRDGMGQSQASHAEGAADTRPYTVNTLDEHLDMLMVCHHLDPAIPEDIAFAESRIRKETIAAEDILHDLGALSMMSSDSQAMGRVGEVIIRTWQTPHKMKLQRGSLPGDNEAENAGRSVTLLNIPSIPAIAHGIANEVGSVEACKLADLVLWSPAFFGIKPDLVIKGGTIVMAAMNDPNASIPTLQPVHYRPMFGAFGGVVAATCVTFVSQAAMEAEVGDALGLDRRVIAVRDTRGGISKASMIHNDATPVIEVDPETYEVRCRRNGSLGLRPGVVRIPRSAKTPR